MEKRLPTQSVCVGAMVCACVCVCVYRWVQTKALEAFKSVQLSGAEEKAANGRRKSAQETSLYIPNRKYFAIKQQSVLPVCIPPLSSTHHFQCMECEWSEHLDVLRHFGVDTTTTTSEERKRKRDCKKARMSLEMFLHFTVTLCGNHVLVVILIPIPIPIAISIHIVCSWRGSSVLQLQLPHNSCHRPMATHNYVMLFLAAKWQDSMLLLFCGTCRQQSSAVACNKFPNSRQALKPQLQELQVLFAVCRCGGLTNA